MNEGVEMKSAGKIFFYLSVVLLCCSALFLLLLTASGFLFGIYSVFFGEPELNGIVSPRSAGQVTAEGIIFCIWFFGAGAGFVANIALLYRMMKIYHAGE